MIDALTVDQLRTFIAAAEEGSFSSAGRKLRRAQSVVSQTLANLEAQLGVALFDRSGRYPTLTTAGQTLLIAARNVVQEMDALRAQARAMTEGLEPELSIAVDVMYPIDGLAHAIAASYEAFPDTPLRLYVESLGGVAQRVRDGVCSVGIVGSLPEVPDELHAEYLCEVPFATVVAPHNALAAFGAVIPIAEIVKHLQIILTDRTTLSQGKNFAVSSPQVWRVADLDAKLALLQHGFGWGHMPLHRVAEALERGRLVKIRVEGYALEGSLPMKMVHRKDTPPGPAGRAFVARLR